MWLVVLLCLQVGYAIASVCILRESCLDVILLIGGRYGYVLEWCLMLMRWYVVFGDCRNLLRRAALLGMLRLLDYLCWFLRYIFGDCTVRELYRRRELFVLKLGDAHVEGRIRSF